MSSIGKRKSDQEILKAIIQLMRDSGLKIESPYDVENWVTDNAENHSKLFETGMFKEE